jgi:hypothetical protein
VTGRPHPRTVTPHGSGSVPTVASLVSTNRWTRRGSELPRNPSDRRRTAV